MSSTLSIINWAPTKITPTLNGKQLRFINPSEPEDNYFPYDTSVMRVTGTPANGTWGDVNNLTLTSTDSSQTQIYNSLDDPENASANIALQLWVFPTYVVFTQLGRFLERVTPQP